MGKSPITAAIAREPGADHVSVFPHPRHSHAGADGDCRYGYAEPTSGAEIEMMLATALRAR